MKATFIVLCLCLGMGCGKDKETPVKEPTKEDVVGRYEVKAGEITLILVLLENGKGELWENGKKQEEGIWKIVGNEVHILPSDHTTNDKMVLKIESKGDLTVIAEIKDGKREEAPKEFRTTYKKSNN